MGLHDDEKTANNNQSRLDQKPPSLASTMNDSPSLDGSTRPAAVNKVRDDGIHDQEVAPSKEADAADTPTPNDEDTEFVEGAKLFLVATSVSVIMLLSMLDISIIGTVSRMDSSLESRLRVRKPRMANPMQQ